MTVLGLIALAALASAEVVEADTLPEKPTPPKGPDENVYVSAERNYQEAKAILADPACRECRPLSGTFVTYDEFHFGFLLKLDSDFRHDMSPIFGPGTREMFLEAFSADSPLLVHGKNIYCECSGWIVEHNGRTYFKINEARLFGE